MTDARDIATIHCQQLSANLKAKFQCNQQLLKIKFVNEATKMQNSAGSNHLRSNRTTNISELAILLHCPRGKASKIQNTKTVRHKNSFFETTTIYYQAKQSLSKRQSLVNARLLKDKHNLTSIRM